MNDDDDNETAFYDRSKRPKKATKRGHESQEEFRKRAVEMATPTVVTPDAPRNPVPPRDRSGDILVVSMKTPEPDKGEAKRQLEAKAHQVKLRPMSELSSADMITPPRGYLAPPRDPKQARKRRMRELVVWGSVVIVIACVVMLGVWLVAR